MTPIIGGAAVFQPWPKIPRLSREVIITEKIDGTNAQIEIFEGECPHDLFLDQVVSCIKHDDGKWYCLRAGSRSRYLMPGKTDNFGFAGWVRDYAWDLVKLGVGRHYGEWWGNGIQRGYGLAEKRFSLFNVSRWAANDTCVLEGQERAPECCHVVPVLARGIFASYLADSAVESLRENGSVAAPGFHSPEGIILYHTAGNHLYKKLLENDDVAKAAA